MQQWREKNYQGASVVTKRLLEWWFVEEHFVKQEKFKFWRAQQEAVEALIYVYEVRGYHNLYSLAKDFQVKPSIDATADDWPKYCFKMASGSGKAFGSA